MLLLFDKVGLPEPLVEELESQEELIERASTNVGFFWMIAAANVKNLLYGDLSEFHRNLLWLDHNIHEVRAALRGERALLDIVTSAQSAREGEESMEKLLSARMKPTAAFCANDLLALGFKHIVYQPELIVRESSSS